jgi:hypothetical protein
MCVASAVSIAYAGEVHNGRVPLGTLHVGHILQSSRRGACQSAMSGGGASWWLYCFRAHDNEVPARPSINLFSESCEACGRDIEGKKPLELARHASSTCCARHIGVANMASYVISSSFVLVIHDNMIIGTNHIVLACLCRHF